MIDDHFRFLTGFLHNMFANPLMWNYLWLMCFQLLYSDWVVVMMIIGMMMNDDCNREARWFVL